MSVDDYDAEAGNAVYVANLVAARATRAWLTGRGLGAEIDELRWSADADPIPAPGLQQALEHLGDRCMQACASADTVHALIGQGHDDETGRAVVGALTEADRAASEAELWMRRIAQICLGTSAALTWNDAVARAERGAVIVLKPMDEESPELADDGVFSFSQHYAELGTELAGLFSRLIIDHACFLSIEPRGRSNTFGLTCTVDEIGNLGLALDLDPSENSGRLVDLGWERDGDQLVAQWEDPLVVMEPVQLIIATLRDELSVSSPKQLALAVGHTEAP